MATLSSFDIWMPLLAVLIVCVGVFGNFKGRALVVILALTIGSADGIVDNGAKHLVNRPRPTQIEPARVVDFQKAKPRLFAFFRPLVVKISQPQTGAISGRSFPSGHVMNNFAVAVVLSAFYGRRGWPYFLFAAGVGYSRIYTGAHWPSDVAASVFIGIGVGLLGLAAAEGAWHRFGSRIAPALYRRHPRLILKEGASV